MSKWGDICRVCASPAKYDIFDKIPLYLHEEQNGDVINWMDPISSLMQEATAIKCRRDDELPNKICALCISYLKHAVTFRRKAVNSLLNFFAVLGFKEIVENTKDVGNYEEEKNKILNDKVSKKLFDADVSYLLEKETNLKAKTFFGQQKHAERSQSNEKSTFFPQIKSKTHKDTLRYLAMRYDKGPAKDMDEELYELTDTLVYEDDNDCLNLVDRDEAAAAAAAAAATCSNVQQTTIEKHLSSYCEKEFEEDDIMDAEILKDVVAIHVPETSKEIKCPYCYKRFMLDESYCQHIESCVYRRFIIFINILFNLMTEKEAKRISPTEFLRRIIFHVKCQCKFILEELHDNSLLDIFSGSIQKQQQERESENSAEETTQDEENEENLNKQPLLGEYKTRIEETPLDGVIRTTPINRSSTKKLYGEYKTRREKTAASDIIRATPINISNNILHEIERSESRNSQKSIKKPIPILGTMSSHLNLSSVGLNNSDFIAGAAEVDGTAAMPRNEQFSFMQKLQNANNIQHMNSPPRLMTPLHFESTANISFSPFTSEIKKKELESNTQQQHSNTTPRLTIRRDLLKQTAQRPKPHILPFAGRCPTCDLLFDTLSDLEMHNAINHNPLLQLQQLPNINGNQRIVNNLEEQNVMDKDREEEYNRIIKLFENDDD